MGDHHGHTHGTNKSTKILLWCFGITLLFAAVEALTGWYSNSLTLLSDAGHMVADSFTLIMAAGAAWLASKPPSQKHSFGLGRAEVITAWFSSILLIIVVIAVTIEAIERFETPHVIKGGMVIVVAALGLIINIIVAAILSKGEKTLNNRAAMMHVMGDLLGSVAALISGSVVYYTGWDKIDPILSLFICILILLSSLRILRESFLVLMEGVPKHLDLETIGLEMAKLDAVYAVHDLHIWTLSSNIEVLTAHVQIDSLNEWESVFTQLRQLLHDKYEIEHVTLQPEVIAKELKRMPNS